MSEPQPTLFEHTQARWPVSGAWLRQRHACGIHHIQTSCGGMCCRHTKFWPPSSGWARGHQGCTHLTPTGCALGADRPITCHLYPLRFNPQMKLVGHAPAFSRNARPCQGAHHPDAPMLIDTLRDSLIRLFGSAQYERVRTDVLAGHDSYFEPDSWTLEQWQRERSWEAADQPPQPMPPPAETP